MAEIDMLAHVDAVAAEWSMSRTEVLKGRRYPQVEARRALIKRLMALDPAPTWTAMSKALGVPRGSLTWLGNDYGKEREQEYASSGSRPWEGFSRKLCACGCRRFVSVLRARYGRIYFSARCANTTRKEHGKRHQA